MIILPLRLVCVSFCFSAIARARARVCMYVCARVCARLGVRVYVPASWSVSTFKRVHFVLAHPVSSSRSLGTSPFSRADQQRSGSDHMQRLAEHGGPCGLQLHNCRELGGPVRHHAGHSATRGSTPGHGLPGGHNFPDSVAPYDGEWHPSSDSTTDESTGLEFRNKLATLGALQ